MTELNTECSKIEPRILNEAEIDAVSGGDYKVNMGVLGTFEFVSVCAFWSMDLGDGLSVMVGKCP